MAVDVSQGEDLEFGHPQELFTIDHRITNEVPFRSMPDGKHILVKRYSRTEEIIPLTFVQNWARLLDQN
jgi:hypothetical protein